MPDLIGLRIDQYEVLERLGSGGMGEVYLARDDRLDRMAALKFLPEDLANDEVARTRLLREARAAAALDHPSICKVYAIGEHEDHLYLALEYIPGRTLQRVLREGLLPLDRVLKITTEICQALEAAHEKGIVHRDLKPSNLMFTESGRIKVLDFGLAKRHDSSADTDAPLTETGMAIGTIPYMSPEQLNGDVLDHRSDLFSLGTLLYEMLTGVHPFGRQVNMETAMAILTKAAPPMHRVGESIPSSLQETVFHLLTKTPETRFQSAAMVLDALQNPNTQARSPLHEASTVITPRVLANLNLGQAPPVADRSGQRSSLADAGPSSVAVLPFASLSPNPEDEYFADGLADEITTALAKIRPLRVVARTSAFVFKGRNEDVRTIGRELNAELLVQGSVRRAGTRARIGVQLVSTEDAGHLWSETYDRELLDVFAVQDEIARSIVATLRLQLSSGTVKALAVPRTNSLEAYQLYLQARHNVRMHTGEGMQEALRCYHEAIELDPEYAPALVGCAEAYITMLFFSVIPSEVGYPTAKDLVTRALALDPNVDNARGVLASIHSNWEWDFAGAEAELRVGIEGIPNYAAGYFTLAVLLANLGRHDEALDCAHRAHELDPLNSVVTGEVGYALLYGRRFEESEDWFRTARERHPASAFLAVGQAVAQRAMGRMDDAVATLESAPTMLGGVADATLATCYPGVGREDEARAILVKLEEAATAQTPGAFLRAVIHVALGEYDCAIELLEMAAERKEGLVVSMAVQPTLDPLHGNARFDALLRKIGLPTRSVA